MVLNQELSYPYPSLPQSHTSRALGGVVIVFSFFIFCFYRCFERLLGPQVEAMQISLEAIASIEDNRGLRLKYSKGFNGFRVFIDFLYTFLRGLSLNILLVVVTCAFTGF